VASFLDNTQKTGDSEMQMQNFCDALLAYTTGIPLVITRNPTRMTIRQAMLVAMITRARTHKRTHTHTQNPAINAGGRLLSDAKRSVLHSSRYPLSSSPCQPNLPLLSVSPQGRIVGRWRESARVERRRGREGVQLNLIIDRPRVHWHGSHPPTHTNTRTHTNTHTHTQIGGLPRCRRLEEC
jgi:hypothetical protein